MDLLVDTANLYARNQFKLGYLTTSDGRASGGLFGFIRSITALSERYQPETIYLALEGGGSAARKELFADYKANRPEGGLWVEDHYDEMRYWAGRYGADLVRSPDGEADDCIAHLADDCKQAVIVSTDADFRALLRGDEVIMVSDVSKPPYTAARLEEEFACQPNDWWKVRALSGDKSDNIPGIPRIGDKTAAKICTRHDWEWARILEDEKVVDWREQVELNAALVSFRPVDPEIDRSEPDAVGLEDFYRKWEFDSLLKD